MLVQLEIRNLVTVKALSLDFGAGVSAMTGETGAGKSILVDAVDLALGGKADKQIIRNNCDRAEITAIFELEGNPPALAWLEQHELTADDECILHRVLVSEGRARAYINNRAVPLQQLREFGDLLVDIHGQHAHQSLLRAASQRTLLDAYASTDELLTKVRQSYRDCQQTRAALAEILETAADASNRSEYLRFQLAEIEGLDLSPAHLEALDREQTLLANAEQLGTELSRLQETLFDSEHSVHGQLSHAISLLGEVSQLDPALTSSAALLEEASIQVEEAISGIRGSAEEISIDPAKLAEVDSELGQVHGLSRKHHLEPSQLQAHFSGLSQELASLENFDDNIEQLKSKLSEHETKYGKLAQQLSSKRRKAAKALSRSVTDSMHELGLSGGTFDIQCEQAEATQNGIDRVAFLVAANPGQAAGPLSKIASGGELSRISLAIQVATAGQGSVPTLIYDEVDVGIGGAVAAKVGKLLRKLGHERQVLVVTHLPQVAAQAHHQMQVSKQVLKGNTETSVLVLDDQQRIQEVARMLGSEEITDQSLAHAEELIRESA
ncbi:MAG: DNA repair protein RecN [bacterium]